MWRATCYTWLAASAAPPRRRRCPPEFPPPAQHAFLGKCRKQAGSVLCPPPKVPLLGSFSGSTRIPALIIISSHPTSTAPFGPFPSRSSSYLASLVLSSSADEESLRVQRIQWLRNTSSISLAALAATVSARCDNPRALPVSDTAWPGGPGSGSPNSNTSGKPHAAPRTPIPAPAARWLKQGRAVHTPYEYSVRRASCKSASCLRNSTTAAPLLLLRLPMFVLRK